MTPKEVLTGLKALCDERVRARNVRIGGGTNQFGVPPDGVKALARKIRTNHELAAEMDGMVRSGTFLPVAGWLNAYVVKNHPDRESLRLVWVTADDPVAARAGWGLTAARVAKDPDGLDVVALLDRIEAEMGDAASAVQWTMDGTLAEIGIRFPKFRTRALAIGETPGVYRGDPWPNGCTSPFASIWINEMVRRQG